MKVIWKSTSPLINHKTIEAQLKAINLMQQLQEWKWLEKKLSNHFEKNETRLNNT